MSDDSQPWRIERVTAAEVYGRGVDPGTPWVAVFGQPITPESLGRIVPDPFGED